ncbi:MAG: ABC transporter ATP-binding protein [Candidatus Bathyarchaeota archaeon]|nr:ABC transporter ATP-binding protein [Candidatus Bathyarchaeota archaeon]MDI9577514.1 ABC transporter ATP-binding protein [Thermoproteota archaeon]
MKILWKYLKPQKWLIVIALVLAGISQLMNLIDPVIFGKIIDDYALNPGNLQEADLVNGVLFWLGLAIIVALFARIAKALQDYFTRLSVQKFGMQIFNDGLKQTLRLSYNEFEDQRSGETLSILQKVRMDTQIFMNTAINVLFSSIIGMGFLILYAVTKSWMLIPIFVIGILVLGSITGLLSKKLKTTQRAINRETNKMSGVITESLRNIELVKSLGLTFPEIRRLQDQTLKIFNLEMTKVKKVRSLTFLQGTALNILKSSILFILLWLIFRNVLTTGELISMQFISTVIFGPLQELGSFIISYQEVGASVNTFDQLIQKPIEHNPEEPIVIDDLQVIKFNDVKFRHKTATFNAVDGISFEVKTGETIAFVGPSGSGKSTLVKLLVGLYRPLSGEIYFNGYPSSQIRYNPLRRQIGFVSQEPQLFAGTIKENLLFVKSDATDQQMREALQKAACDTLLKRSSSDIETVIGEGGLKLSGGEKQRISIARAILRHPRLLIFDEATSSLDSLTEQEITNTIRDISISREQITILIAHRLSTIMHADLIYVLERGQIVETGSHAELLEQKGLYYAMWRQQIGERRDITQ